MSARAGFNPWLQVPLWAAGNSLAGAAIGLALGLFKEGEVEGPILIISILFGNVVGFTAIISSMVLFSRIHGLPPAVRALLLGLALLSGSVIGSIAVLNFYPLFIFREPRLAGAVVAINGILSVIVGGVVYGYEGMRHRLQASLREVEEVRLVEARLREEAARAELAALQARINPHFFFNTLNTIASLLDEDPQAAETVVQTLAELFRYTFKVADTGPVALEEELGFTRAYVTIERARFGERLRVHWKIAPESTLMAVPGMIVQPLVENAVGHGIAPRSAGGVVEVVSRVEGDVLRIEVIDDGRGLEQRGEDLIRDGHGLGNVRQRLEAHHGDRARLELENNPAGRGTLARLLLPASRHTAAGTDGKPSPGIPHRSEVER